jgi:tetratricopeptide (TPR) repeat protein
MTDQLTEVRESIQQGDFQEARRLALCALVQPQDQETQARLTHNLALATHRAGDNAEALRILVESASLFENTGPTIKGNYHNELGIVLYNSGHIDKAVIEYRKAIEYYRQAGNEAYRAGTINNLSLAMKDAGRYRAAYLYNRLARRILDRAQDARILADVLDSHSAIIAAQAASQGEQHDEQPTHSRETASEPQSTRAP